MSWPCHWTASDCRAPGLLPGSGSSKGGSPPCQGVQCCSRTALCADHRPLDLLSDCPPNPPGTAVSQGLSQRAQQSSGPGHGLAWAQGQSRKGQTVEITGWMRPSRDVTVPGATLLSEVIAIKLPVAKPALEASDRFTWAG